MSWFRRLPRSGEDTGDLGEPVSPSYPWVQTLPGDAQMFVYERGRYLARFPVHHAYMHGLESLIEQEFGPGAYTVMPQFDGRLHSGRRITIGTELQRQNRRNLNEHDATFRENIQSGGLLGVLGLVGRLDVAQTAIANGIRLDDQGMVGMAQAVQNAADHPDAVESDSSAAAVDGRKKGGQQADDPHK